ncbi:MAG: hypothetical protein JZU60_02555 [Ilumatobacteraceae bacterium]|nr:hypothetical protein [Ilumatobacteraceae bacterium]
MEENFRNKFGFEKALVLVVVLGTILTGLIYLLLYAPFTANNKFVIPVRKDFYENVLYKVFTPERLPYGVMVREINRLVSGEMEYSYALIGRLVAVDVKGSLLSIKDKNGMVWEMDFGKSIYPAVEGADYRNLMVSEVIKYHLLNIAKPEEPGSYLQPGDIVRDGG